MAKLPRIFMSRVPSFRAPRLLFSLFFLFNDNTGFPLIATKSHGSPQKKKSHPCIPCEPGIFCLQKSAESSNVTVSGVSGFGLPVFFFFGRGGGG